MSIVTIETLLRAYQKTCPSVQKKAEIFQITEILAGLERDINNRTYVPERYNCFVVRDPKLREIFAPSFRDRIVHHVIVDRIQPFLDPQFIHDSFANRSCGGVHVAIKRLKKFMRQVSPTAYFLQCDVQSYFTSINKTILFRILKEKILKIQEILSEEKDLIIWLSSKVIFQNPALGPNLTGNSHLLRNIPPHKSLFHAKPDIGLPIGSLTSQFFSNIFLNELDQFCKNTLKIKRYIRYVDDFVMIHESPTELNIYKDEISRFLSEKLDLKLHPKKTLMQPIHRGCDFLGYVVRPHYVMVRKRCIKALKKRLYFFNHLLDPECFPHSCGPSASKLTKFLKQGFLCPPVKPKIDLLLSMQQVINSYYGIFAHADSQNLRVTLFQKHFHKLRDYFYPRKKFTKFGLRPLERLRREGLIDL